MPLGRWSMAGPAFLRLRGDGRAGGAGRRGALLACARPGGWRIAAADLAGDAQQHQGGDSLGCRRASCWRCRSPIWSCAIPGRYSLLVSQSVYLGFGLPGIVIALSLVFFGANYAPVLYQTFAMLIFAYIVRFLPQAVGNVRSGLLQISPRLEEAGRSMGLNRRQTLWHITIPLLRPGIWAGAAIVFMSTMKELPATLLLGPTGFTTLATQIWAAADEAFFARAGRTVAAAAGRLCAQHRDHPGPGRTGDNSGSDDQKGRSDGLARRRPFPASSSAICTNTLTTLARSTASRCPSLQGAPTWLCWVPAAAARRRRCG